MSKRVKIVLSFGLFAFFAACAQQEEVVYVDPEPVTVQPVTGKYK